MRDAHRVFLQSFMSRGILNGASVKKLYIQACEKFNEQPDDSKLAEFVNTINMMIRPLHLEIKKAIHEENRTHYYCIVNSGNSDVTKLCSDFALNELEYFKKLVEAIIIAGAEVETNRPVGVISSIEALNLADSLDKRISKNDAEQIIEKLKRNYWLDATSAGEITLSTRSILELSQYIFETYPDHAVKCNVCNRLCVRGQCCSECDVKLHLDCSMKLFGKSTEPKCPNSACHTKWPHQVVKAVSQNNSQDSSPKAGTSQANNDDGKRRKRKL